MLAHTPDQLSQQLGKQRRTVDFDTFDIQLQQLLWMLAEGQVSVAPAYQRQFRWDETRCSELIESLILGIPVPNLFMATNDDNTWETVDGVQRLSAIVKFAGDENLRNDLSLGHALELSNLKKLSLFNGLRFNNLPTLIQQHVSSTLYEFGQVSACNRPIASSPADRPEGFLPTRYRALMLKNTQPPTGAAVPLPKRR